ncbi:MAG TPA: 5'-nucleotidase, partial [Armatimonadota bacterium]
GNFVADALRNATSADVALVYAQAFSPPEKEPLIAMGTTTEDDFRRCLFIWETQVYTLKLTAVQLRATMQQALRAYPQETNRAFLQISGMTVTFDSSKPAPLRIVSIRVGDKLLDFTEKDTKTTYLVAMPQELAVGGSIYGTVFGEAQKTLNTKLGVTVKDAVAKEFVRQKGTISPKVEDRLVDVKPKPVEPKTAAK